MGCGLEGADNVYVNYVQVTVYSIINLLSQNGIYVYAFVSIIAHLLKLYICVWKYIWMYLLQQIGQAPLWRHENYINRTQSIIFSFELDWRNFPASLSLLWSWPTARTLHESPCRSSFKKRHFSHESKNDIRGKTMDQTERESFPKNHLVLDFWKKTLFPWEKFLGRVGWPWQWHFN